MRHEVYLPDRPENRLLKLALERVRQCTHNPDSWRLAQELSFRLAEIPPSRQLAQDFRAWGQDRLLTHYRASKPWCELILNQHMPLAIAGDFQGMSLLFPMEKLFERYVARWLRQQLPTDAVLRTPARSKFLCRHDAQDFFRLKPDLFVIHQGQSWVLDTKWKLLDSSKRADKYGLSPVGLLSALRLRAEVLGRGWPHGLDLPANGNFPEPA